MKAVGYIRVSTEEQAKHGISLDVQRSKIHSYASLEEMELVEVIADEGISGSTINGRPGIQRVLEAVKARQVKAVIVFKLDRLARNTIEALQIAKLVDRHGVGLHSIMEKLDTKSAMGRFFFTLMASIAEMERGIISERIRAAMDQKRRKGEACSGNPPYGCSISDNYLVPNHDELTTIQRIHDLHSAGHTIWGIVDILTNEGILNRKNKPFGKTQVHAIILRKAA